MDDDLEEFLEHYGVKGMRWGVRRAQRKQTKQDVKDAEAYLKATKARNRSERAQVIRRRAAVSAAIAVPGAGHLLAIQLLRANGRTQMRDLGG